MITNNEINSNRDQHNIPEDELLTVIADFLDLGHVDNIRAMFKQTPKYLAFSGIILNDERFNVRLGMAVLFEYLIEECPDEMYRALPSLSQQLQSDHQWVRGEAVNLLGIIGSAKALTLVAALAHDPSPQVAEIVRDILGTDNDG